MRPVDFVKALGVALLILVLDLLCAFGAVSIWALLNPPAQPLTPSDPIVVQISTLSTRICGPLLFALFVWLLQRRRPPRNDWAFAAAVFGFYFLIDAGLAMLPAPGVQQPAAGIATMLQPGVLLTMTLKLAGAFSGAWLARR